MAQGKELEMALHLLILNFKDLAERNPGVQIGAAAVTFNQLLAQAKKLQPGSAVIQGVSPLKPEDSALALITSASALYGAWIAAGGR